MSGNDLEAPVPDVEEQLRDVVEDEDEDAGEDPAHLPLEVNEADAVEQHREVSLDEDDYR